VATYKEIPAACQTSSDPFQPYFAPWEVDAAVRRKHMHRIVVGDGIALNTRASAACQKENPETLWFSRFLYYAFTWIRLYADDDFHLFFEPVFVVLVNFGVCSGSIAALEFRVRGFCLIFHVFMVRGMRIDFDLMWESSFLCALQWETLKEALKLRWHLRQFPPGHGLSVRFQYCLINSLIYIQSAEALRVWTDRYRNKLLSLII